MSPYVSDLMHSYEEVFPQELPIELPPMTDIQNDIDLLPSSALPNRVAYRMTTMEKEKLNREVQDLLDKEYKGQALVLMLSLSY